MMEFLKEYGSILALLILSAVSVMLITSWQRNHPNFDLSDILTGDNGRVSLSKLGQATALVVSTWGFISLVAQGKLTEFYFVGYMVAWSATRLTNQYLGKETPASQKELNA